MVIQRNVPNEDRHHDISSFLKNIWRYIYFFQMEMQENLNNFKLNFLGDCGRRCSQSWYQWNVNIKNNIWVKISYALSSFLGNVWTKWTNKYESSRLEWIEFRDQMSFSLRHWCMLCSKTENTPHGCHQMTSYFRLFKYTFVESSLYIIAHWNGSLGTGPK